MRIGMIGVGHIGGTLAGHFVAAGHEVAVSNSRGPATLGVLIGELGARAQALTAGEAARFGDLVLVSVPFGRYRELPTEGVAGKVVIEIARYAVGKTLRPLDRSEEAVPLLEQDDLAFAGDADRATRLRVLARSDG